MILIDQRLAQQREPIGDGLVVTRIAVLVQNLHQLRMAAMTQLARRIPFVRFDQRAPGGGRDLLPDALAEQETGEKPFEQALLVALLHRDAEIGGRHVSTHGNDLDRGANALTSDASDDKTALRIVR
ncbi:hypothetical protein [Rhodanobacter terrae]|uniref:Uncharacterized protein n=1 Tax=Rhodanobacter terrae TaxID=418647 RepID=A0ABW0ST41_9GAMM